MSQGLAGYWWHSDKLGRYGSCPQQADYILLGKYWSHTDFLIETFYKYSEEDYRKNDFL